MCQVRPYTHLPCGCVSHDLHICTTTFPPRPRPCPSCPSPTPQPQPQPPISHPVNAKPRFTHYHTIPTTTFIPLSLTQCPTFVLHPPVLSPYPCPSHWDILRSNRRMVIGPPGPPRGRGEEDVYAGSWDKGGVGTGGFYVGVGREGCFTRTVIEDGDWRGYDSFGFGGLAGSEQRQTCTRAQKEAHDGRNDDQEEKDGGKDGRNMLMGTISRYLPWEWFRGKKISTTSEDSRKLGDR